MCGIVGYIGKQRALPVLLDGLKNLEYRGYDSAGFVVVTRSGNLSGEKAIGKIVNLENKIAGKNNFAGNCGVAHTRWATHGGVTEANAHPHSDCKGNMWLVHNGIIENYKELKEELENIGHTFRSETDTEVLVHLIEEFQIKNQELPFEEAVRLALLSIRGTYGIAAVCREEPQKLVAARNFSPLLLGIGDGEYFIASDASAVLKHTKQVVYLDDGEMAVLTPGEHHVFDLKRVPREKPLHEIEWTHEQAEKGGFSHFMLKEIFESPDAVENSIRGRLIPEDGRAKLGGLESVSERVRSIGRVIITACGTARFAGLFGEYAIEEYAGVPVEVEYGSELRYRKPIFSPDTALVAISQSGETADTLAAIREAKQKGLLTLGVVNVVGSTIARETDAGVYIHAGPEIAVASTKAFVAQLAAMVLFMLFLGRQRGMSLVMGERIAKELAALPALMRHTLKLNDAIREIARKYQHAENFLFLGRKYNYPIALEGDIKLKEVSYVHSEAYAAGEMKHGPIAMIDEKFPSIFIVPKDSVYEKTISNMEEVRARRGPVIAIATQGDERIKQLARDVVYIPKTLEMLTPLLSVIPLQLFAYHFGVLRGNDVDKPRNLAKSVTVE